MMASLHPWEPPIGKCCKAARECRFAILFSRIGACCSNQSHIGNERQAELPKASCMKFVAGCSWMQMSQAVAAITASHAGKDLNVCIDSDHRAFLLVDQAHPLPHA